jgi:hypothetical protein
MGGHCCHNHYPICVNCFENLSQKFGSKHILEAITQMKNKLKNERLDLLKNIMGEQNEKTTNKK